VGGREGERESSLQVLADDRCVVPTCITVEATGGRRGRGGREGGREGETEKMLEEESAGPVMLQLPKVGGRGRERGGVLVVVLARYWRFGRESEGGRNGCGDAPTKAEEEEEEEGEGGGSARSGIR